MSSSISDSSVSPVSSTIPRKELTIRVVVLGILFMIPMRKVFILNNTELAYPEGIACAAVLKTGDESSEGGEGRRLLYGGLLGGLVAIAAKLFGVIAGTLEAATGAGK